MKFFDSKLNPLNWLNDTARRVALVVCVAPSCFLWFVFLYAISLVAAIWDTWSELNVEAGDAFRTSVRVLSGCWKHPRR